MAGIRFLNFTEARRKRCDCCDRSLPLADKALIVRGERLLGDLDLCPQCANALKEAVGQAGLRQEDLVQDE